MQPSIHDRFIHIEKNLFIIRKRPKKGTVEIYLRDEPMGEYPEDTPEDELNAIMSSMIQKGVEDDA